MKIIKGGEGFRRSLFATITIYLSASAIFQLREVQPMAFGSVGLNRLTVAGLPDSLKPAGTR